MSLHRLYLSPQWSYSIQTKIESLLWKKINKKKFQGFLREKLSYIFIQKPSIPPSYIIFCPLGRYFGGQIWPTATRLCLAELPNKHANIYICTQTDCIFCSPPGPHMLNAGFQRKLLEWGKKNKTIQTLCRGEILSNPSNSLIMIAVIFSDGSASSRLLTGGNVLVHQLVELNRRMNRKEPWQL